MKGRPKKYSHDKIQKTRQSHDMETRTKTCRYLKKRRIKGGIDAQKHIYNFTAFETMLERVIYVYIATLHTLTKPYIGC
jgi:hypothetical protein